MTQTTNQPTNANEKACDNNAGEDLVKAVKAYAKQHPGTVAMVCFGVGFVLGWKLKPW